MTTPVERGKSGARKIYSCKPSPSLFWPIGAPRLNSTLVWWDVAMAILAARFFSRYFFMDQAIKQKGLFFQNLVTISFFQFLALLFLAPNPS